MRTRIALVAIIPIAVITISTLTLAASEQPARAVTTPTSPNTGTATLAMPSDHLIAYQGITTGAPASTGSKLVFNVEGALSSIVTQAAPAPTAPAVTAPAPVVTPTDTVTPEQRAAWERVAMCEEGGNWAADGGRFSGGLGITRTNWIAYGGGQYASSGAQATEDQQIMVAERIQSSPPDQYGCGSW